MEDVPSGNGMPDVRLDRSSPRSIFDSVFGTLSKERCAQSGNKFLPVTLVLAAGTRLDFGPIRRSQSEAILKVRSSTPRQLLHCVACFADRCRLSGAGKKAV